MRKKIYETNIFIFLYCRKREDAQSESRSQIKPQLKV